MNKFYWIAIAIAPFLLSEIYFAILQHRSRKAIRKFKSADSQLFPDLKVWFKNYNSSKRKNKITTSAFDTLYTFNDCELLLEEDSFLVVGKVKFMGFSRKLYPTVFTNDNTYSGSIKSSRIALIRKVDLVGRDLEIEFEEHRYTDTMTMVIKNADQILSDRIMACFSSLLKETEQTNSNSVDP
ncbi:MAG: hypothetical protein GY751_25225 [Bacteroidetes bacterium]|nr:hypothetical protein [Bacteroidota bacterium]